MTPDPKPYGSANDEPVIDDKTVDGRVDETAGGAVDSPHEYVPNPDESGDGVPEIAPPPADYTAGAP